MKAIVRLIREEEIPRVAEFLEGENWAGVWSGESLGRSLTAQFHRQGDLVQAIFVDGESIVGAIMARGQGDTVSIIHVWAVEKNFYELIKKLILAEEKASRRYGYSQIFLSATLPRKNFLVALGYKPRLLFTFSTNRKELFEIFSQLYPLWIEAGGEKVKVLLGGDHLEEKVKSSLSKYSVQTDYLFLKNL